MNVNHAQILEILDETDHIIWDRERFMDRAEALLSPLDLQKIRTLIRDIVESSTSPQKILCRLGALNYILQSQERIQAMTDKHQSEIFEKFRIDYLHHRGLLFSFIHAQIPMEHWVDLASEYIALIKAFATVGLEDSERLERLRGQVGQRRQDLIRQGFSTLDDDLMGHM